MNPLPIQYCYFSFRHKDEKHDLRVMITPSISLQYTLYIDDMSVGTVTDHDTNILIAAELNKALSFETIDRIYQDLLKRK